MQNNSVHTCETLWNIPGTYEALSESVSFYNKAKDDDNDTFSAIFFFEQRTVVATWAKRCYQQVLENTGNIGKAYRRHDEVGTPICLTVDFETIEQQPESVTVRDRDTMEQIRINTADLPDYLRNYFL